MVSQDILDQLGRQHGTDKSSLHHDFLSMYERFLSPLRSQPVKMLEIGVSTGSSLRMWRDYFEHGSIVGLDVNGASRVHQSERAIVEIGDQSSIADLTRIARDHGPFDIIVDDGSHMWDHQIITLQYMLPHVKRAGYYILEDLDTSYGQYEVSYKGRSAESAAKYLQRLSDYLIGDEVLDIEAEKDAFIRTFARKLSFILFAKRTSILQLRA